jgi:hypothetical protein
MQDYLGDVYKNILHISLHTNCLVSKLIVLCLKKDLKIARGEYDVMEREGKIDLQCLKLK